MDREIRENLESRDCQTLQNIIVEVSNHVLNVRNRFRTLELLEFEPLDIL